MYKKIRVDFISQLTENLSFGMSLISRLKVLQNIERGLNFAVQGISETIRNLTFSLFFRQYLFYKEILPAELVQNWWPEISRVNKFKLETEASGNNELTSSHYR